MKTFEPSDMLDYNAEQTETMLRFLSGRRLVTPFGTWRRKPRKRKPRPAPTRRVCKEKP